MGLVQGFKGMILPTGVSLSANTASVGNGATYQLEAYITPDGATNNKIHRSASNNNVTVDENGLVTGVTDGTSIVTATTDYGGYTASCTFTVYTVHVTGISFDTDKITLTPGKTYQLTANITPNNATNKNVTWRSTNTSVAVVDNNGLVTCIDNGDAEIIVTTVDGNYSDSCTIVTDWSPTENTWVYLPLNGTLDRYGTQEGTVVAGSDIGWTDITSIAKGINFKGNTNSYVQINSVPEMNTDFTINFWIYLNGLSDAIMVERGTADSTNRDLHYVVRNSGHTADLGFYSNDCPGTTALNTGTWYNLMATYNHTTKEQKVYINGVIDNTRTGSGDPVFGTGPLYIGCKKSYSSSNPTNGTMCRFILEDKVWTAEEGIEYYNLTKGIIFKDDINNYDELEYIESSGSQYIDTGVTFDTNDKLNNMEMYIKATHSGTGNFMGLYNGSYVTMEVASNANTLRCFTGNSSTHTDRSVLHSDNTTIDEITYNYTSSLATFTINGTEYTQSRSNGYNTGNTHLTIFARNNNGSMEQYLTMKMYSCYVKIGGELVCDFMPARRKSDGIVGLYDKVEDKFYTNSGSGTFTAGPAIGIFLDEENIHLLTAGATKQLNVTCNPSSIASGGYIWRSSDTAVATVNSSGLVTCVTPGECTITVISNTGGYEATCDVDAEDVQPVSQAFSFTGKDQDYTIPYTQCYKLEAWGAGSNTSAGGYASGIMRITKGTVYKIMVGQSGSSTSSGTYGFGGTSNLGSNRSGGGLSGVFTGNGAITSSDSARALVIGGGAGAGGRGAGGAGGGETGADGVNSGYGTLGGGGTQTGHGSSGNAGNAQFQGGGGSGTYGYGGGGGWRGGNASVGDSSADDDKGAGGGSGYVINSATDKVLTQGGGMSAGCNGCVKITSI